MDYPHALPQQVTEALARGWTVLTANQRAARTHRHTYDLQQQSLGRANWEPPEIIAWDAWLGSLWSRLLLDGHASDLLLSPTQEHTVWRAVIGSDSGMASLRPIDSLAQTAASAWNLLHTYNAHRQLQNYAGNFDNRAFLRWSKEFDQRCKRAHYLTESQLPEALQTAIAQGYFTLPAGLVLVGFDSKTPAQIALLEAIRTTGTQINESALPTPETRSTLVDAPDTNAELAACARWLRTRLTEQPDASLAVIVPNIESDRPEIDRVFRQTLAPELEDIAAPSGTGPYEFSLGVTLASTPMVATALDILRWSIGPLALDRVSALLLSPYFAATSPDAIELHARAEFDAFVLRKEHLLRPEVSADSLFSIISHSKFSSSLPAVLDRLRALKPLFNRVIFDRDKERTHAEWAAAFHELLEAAAWAVPSHLDSIEFQTRSKWDSLLDELATLDFDNIAVPFASALTSLERIATETLFAPESRHAPVQIMGPLESAGSSFDAIWFLRANDLSWPLTPSPNPLLPWQLQRDRAMPGANLDAETDLSRRITERIAASAPAVLFSYALEAADGHQRPSPVVTRLSPSASTADNIAPANTTEAALEIEEFKDDAPIPLPPDRVFRGGAGILKAQAECGFRAFAEKRLFSAALESNSLGLSASERGNVVHHILQHFWEQVQSQAALKRMTIAERNAVLKSCIVAALTVKNPRPEAGWPQAYLDTERERLLNLLEPWLDYEANLAHALYGQGPRRSSRRRFDRPSPTQHPSRPRRYRTSRREARRANRRDHHRLQNRCCQTHRLAGRTS